MLNPSDVYVEGGTPDLLACWTDKVTKYDASSFYNWEMDNLPLHDLDERTHFLWEKLGHPTSAITGMSFIVSGDATSSCNPLFFVDLSSCIQALPEVINYPILIEVASFGNLGSLEISNKIFGPRGSLEIVNRNCGFAGAVDLQGVAMSLDVIDDFNKFSLASSVSSFYDASTPSITFDAFNASLLTNGQYIASSSDRWKDPRYKDGHHVFTRRVGRDQLGVLTASINSSVDPWDTTGTLAQASKYLQFDRYDELNRSSDGMDTYDASTLKDFEIVVGAFNPVFPVDNLSDGSDQHQAVAASLYFNHLDSIKVHGCKGPIYIRNFNVDGSKSVENGIEISNSVVNLERCAVSRCTNAGLYATNSNVNLLRGFVAFRNYGFDELGSRVGVSFSSNIFSYSALDSYGAGILADNSTINFKSTYARDIEKSSQASSLVYTDSNYTGDLPVPSQEALFCLSRNDIGIHAINSKIIGGRTELAGSGPTPWSDAAQLFLELNTEAGCRIENSVIDFDGRFSLYGNFYGLDCRNSSVSFDYFKAYANQKAGIRLDNTTFTYNNNTYQGYLHNLFSQARTQYLQHRVTLLGNGTAIDSKDSSISPVYTGSMPDIYESFYVSGTHGLYVEASHPFRDIKPAILLDRSNLDVIHAKLYSILTTNGDREEPCYGELISAKNGSIVSLRGSSQFANTIFGEDNSYTNQAFRSALYATNNSKINIQGPTVIAQYGVDAIADKNSTIEITPHRDSEGTLLASSFDLSNPLNHTMVELHSTRACLVAVDNSEIILEDLGSYHVNWPGNTYGDSIGTEYNYFDYLPSGNVGAAAYIESISGGFLQLYPNGYSQTSQPWANVNPGASRQAFQTGGSFSPVNGNYYLWDNTDPYELSGVTTGGFCIKAHGGSVVNVNNVHFPTGYAQCSANIYDYNGIDGLEPACSRLHVWNIADNSLLKASYLSISGAHPQDAGYIGPSGTWGASEAPITTPDTSSLSVLDYYGIDSNGQNPFGTSSPLNYGAFRLYFSVDPLVNYLVDPSTVVSGYASQIFAQGYNFSGNLSAPGTVSSVYRKALFKTDSGAVSDTGFYYASDIVQSPYSTKAILDESAANAFANAKHNSVGKSNLASVVKIYNNSTNSFGGDSLAYEDWGYGLGSTNNFDLKKDN